MGFFLTSFSLEKGGEQEALMSACGDEGCRGGQGGSLAVPYSICDLSPWTTNNEQFTVTSVKVHSTTYYKTVLP